MHVYFITYLNIADSPPEHPDMHNNEIQLFFEILMTFQLHKNNFFIIIFFHFVLVKLMLKRKNIQ